MPLCGFSHNTVMTEKTKKGLRFLGASLFGVLAGAANGLFGAGGGMLIVPALTYLSKLEEKKAHATAIAVILPLSVLSFVVYTLKGTFDWSKAISVGAGVVAGGAVGALLLKKVPKKLLTFVFYGVMIYAGVKFARGA